jgi:drug/metabolite transporter (DMT)-like permease
MHKISGRWKLGFALSLTASALWGLIPIVIKATLNHVDVATMNWYRIVTGALVLGLFFFLRGGLQLQNWKKPSTALLIIIAIVGMLGNYTAYSLGLNLIPAGGAQVLMQLAGILVLLAGLTLFKERFNHKQWLGLFIFLIGLGLFFNLRIAELVNGTREYLTGAMWILYAAVSWTCYAVVQKLLLREMGSQEILLLIYISGSILFLPSASPTMIFEISGEGLALLITVSLMTVLTFGVFSESLVHWEMSKASIVASTVPLLTFGFVALVNSFIPGYSPEEPMNNWSWAGVILVVVGCSMTALTKIRP